MAFPKFEIKRSKNDQYFFNLRSRGNGEVIATSEMYSSKQACLNGITAVKRDAPDAGIEDLTK